jgi:hypothetical protein
MLRCFCGVGLILLLFSSASYAVTSKQYVISETAITFCDSGQGCTKTMTMANIAAGAGQYSDQLDRGAGAHAADYEWRCWLALTGTNVLNEAVEIYFGTSDGTNNDGGLGTTTSALVTAKRNNLKFMGQLLVDQTTTNVVMIASGLVHVRSRYLTLAFWNATSLPTQNSASVNECSLTPMPFEQQ